MSNGRGQLLYRPNQPQFFKIILADSLHQRKLAIPRKFTRDYGNNLSNWVTLRVPSGKKWKVGIEKVGAQIWLHKGWQEFVEYYSIVIGTFLVFRYDHTNCGFHVTIFDYSTAEIDYPDEAEACRVPEAEETSTEVPVGTSPSRKRKDKSELSSAQTLKNMDKVESLAKLTGKGSVQFPIIPPQVIQAAKESTPPEGNIKVKGSTLSSQPPRKMMKVENVPTKTEKGTNPEPEQENVSLPDQEPRVNRIITRSACMKIFEEKPKAVDRASFSIQSKYPTFQLKMCKSYVECWSNLYIPISFSLEHLKRKDGDATLRGFDGKMWPVKICSSTRRAFIRAHGWKKFVRDNDLKVGDVCTFELTDTHRTTFTVVISRCTSIAINHELEQKPPFPINRPPPIDASEKFTSLFPFFGVVISLSHLQGNSPVHVPGDFVKNMDKKTQYVKLQVGKRSWLVKLILYPQYGNGKLSGGFIAFAKGNCLKVGDVCYFELIDVKNLVIKVFISRVLY